MFRFDCTFSNFNCTKRVQLQVHYLKAWSQPKIFQSLQHRNTK